MLSKFGVVTSARPPGIENAVELAHEVELVFKVLHHLDTARRVHAAILVGQTAGGVDPVARHIAISKVVGVQIACAEHLVRGEAMTCLEVLAHQAREISFARADVHDPPTKEAIANEQLEYAIVGLAMRVRCDCDVARHVRF